jgi:hypothetical protein
VFSVSVPTAESVIEPYRMNRSRRGHILVICNSEFTYGKSATPFPRLDKFRKNIQALQETFQKSLGFEWTLQENLTGYDMFDAVSQGKNSLQ